MTRFRIPVTGVLILGIAGMTFVALTLALYLGFSGAIENTRALLYQRAERMIDSIVKDTGY